MYLRKFIKKLDKKYHNTFFSGIAFNSSQIKKDYIFFAIKGNKFDGNDYIQNAIKQGAKIIISEKNIKFKHKNIIYLRSKNPRKLLAEISYKFIKKRVKKLIAIGTKLLPSVLFPLIAKKI